MFVFFRALTYATLFVGFLFVYLPGKLLRWSGMVRPEVFGWQQAAGMLLGIAGAAIALWCIWAFVWLGRGTPAPFDPPRRLVVRGPYRLVRNPMYLGAAMVCLGAVLYYSSLAILVYGCLFLTAAHLFVVFYEEPALRRSFGDDYRQYCAQVQRWRPRKSR